MAPAGNEGPSILLYCRIILLVVLLQSVAMRQLKSTCCMRRLACRTLTPPTAPLIMPQWNLLHTHQQAPRCATLTCPAALPWTATSMLLSTTSLRCPTISWLRGSLHMLRRRRRPITSFPANSVLIECLGPHERAS